MKIILDDLNLKDAKIMNLLGAAMVQNAAQAAARPQGTDDASDATPVAEAIPDATPVVEAVPDEKPETEQPEGTEDLDSDGVRWDEKLHASTQTKTADGRWKKRRGAAKSAPVKAVAETPEAEEITFDLYKEEIQEHKGKFGIDRTKEIFEQTFGVGAQPSSVSSHDWGKAVEALRSDKGPVTESVDIDDFC